MVIFTFHRKRIHQKRKTSNLQRKRQLRGQKVILQSKKLQWK